MLNADQHFGHRRFSSQILAFQSLPRSSELAAVGSRGQVLGAGRDNFRDTLKQAPQRLDSSAHSPIATLLLMRKKQLRWSSASHAPVAPRRRRAAGDLKAACTKPAPEVSVRSRRNHATGIRRVSIAPATIHSDRRVTALTHGVETARQTGMIGQNQGSAGGSRQVSRRRELVSRQFVREQTMKDAFSFGPFRLYPGKRILRKDGTVVSLGSRAFDMLVAMVEHNGKVLTPGELMAIAWPGLIVDDSNVRVQVANLRRTLGCGRDGARYIANVAGRGYCFVEPVRRIESVDHPSPTTSEPGVAPGAPHVDRVTQTSGSLSSFPPPLEGAIGRDACVAELAQVVKERRLVTVVGAAGAGKTTLAILVAHALDAFDGSISFVDLSTVDGDDMVADALAAAVGYISPGGDFLSGLLEVLSNGKTLIVLDNCEHVIAAVATLCLRIVEGTSNVSFLNTSREALRIEEEFVYLLRPLASPPDMGRLTAKQAMAWPAIQLFMERAREGGARGTLSDDDAPTVAGLCRRLDGNPHAIGLVASRVGTYGIQGVADLFEHQVALHWQGRRDAIPRHQTVEALIDWSHKLLPERDRQVLHRLSVFSGSFPLEAAVAVTSDDAIDALQVGEAIGDLVDKSLVAVSQQSQGTRIRLLETTRAYAASRLARLRATHEFARRHALYYAEQLREQRMAASVP